MGTFYDAQAQALSLGCDSQTLGAVGCVVQSFHARRFHLLTKSVVIPLSLAALAVSQWAGAIMTATGTSAHQSGNKGGNDQNNIERMSHIAYISASVSSDLTC
ncbi:hypothetical protein AN958_07912 [Leucoagaricus sp. SymC.cos]|nr:hypothetical protein AN958_07912 [Leucoagaricus sp. SymC.cos]